MINKTIRTTAIITIIIVMIIAITIKLAIPATKKTCRNIAFLVFLLLLKKKGMTITLPAKMKKTRIITQKLKAASKTTQITFSES
jgi:hypothetical protein